MNILVECNPDEYIISALGFNPRRIKHGQGKGKVLQGLRKGKGKIAIIDEDPGKGNVSLLEEYNKEKEMEDLIFYSHPKNGCHVIVIRPDLENWLLKRAGINGIDPSVYGIPNDADRLHSIIHVERNSRFREMINVLKETDKGLKMISGIIKKNI
jgi:hypothetical protein